MVHVDEWSERPTALECCWDGCAGLIIVTLSSVFSAELKLNGGPTEGEMAQCDEKVRIESQRWHQREFSDGPVDDPYGESTRKHKKGAAIFAPRKSQRRDVRDERQSRHRMIRCRWYLGFVPLR